MNRAESRLALQSFETRLTDINHVDVGHLHALSISVRWPHRAEDWEMLRGYGHGVAALDEIGRVLATAMWFPHDDDFATVGMMITAPRVQTHGAGRWTLEHVIAQNPSRFLALNATRAGRRLYDSLGFVAEKTVFQCQGEAKATPPDMDLCRDEGAVRDLKPDDLPQVLALDRTAFGADRARLYDVLLPVARTTVLERGGRVVAYGLCRRFGRGYVIGPVVAGDPRDAVAVSAPLVARHEGHFVRIDTREAEGVFCEFLTRSGLGVFDTVTTMSLGRPFLPRIAADGPRVFALASHALS